MQSVLTRKITDSNSVRTAIIFCIILYMQTELTENEIFLNNNSKQTKLIKFTLSEVELSINAGILRRKECIRKGNQNSGYGKEKTGVWDADIEGAGAELAFFKYKHLYWEGVVNNFKGPDALSNIQIRNTTLDRGKLIFRDDDNKEHYYILITGRIPYFKIRGFMLGKDTIRDQWVYAPNEQKPAWFVPQENLIDIDLLDCTSKIAKAIK